jgi:hypothetical protein
MSKNNFSPEIIGKALEITVKEQITENVLVSHNSASNNYRIQIWKDGVSAGAVIHGIKKWNQMIKLFEDYCTDLKKATNALDSSAHVTLMILNDLNQFQALATITDGATLYNFMEEKANAK